MSWSPRSRRGQRRMTATLTDSPADDGAEGRIIGGVFAYYDPVRPPAELVEQAERLMADSVHATEDEAERLLREAVERLADAFLIDRRGRSDCFAAAHVLGRQIRERFGCRFAL